jgi:hypothetical protein
MQVGQEVYYYCCYKKDLVKTKITKVGHKYIYVSLPNGWEYKFDKVTRMEVVDWGGGLKLYFDPQEYADDKELNKNIMRIYHELGSSDTDLTLDQSRRILAILEEGKE